MTKSIAPPEAANIAPVGARPRPAFDDLAALEPRLRELERDLKEFAAAYKRRRCRCANAVWYGFGRFRDRGFKSRVSSLVGFHRAGHVSPGSPAQEALLRSTAAYDVAYRHLYDLLPNCRGVLVPLNALERRLAVEVRARKLAAGRGTLGERT